MAERPGKAVHLLHPSADGSAFTINKDVLNIIKGIKGIIAPVLVVGPYRTGKSYVLSRLLNRQKAFDLGHTVASQTKGIWMWDTPFEHTLKDGSKVTVLLFDTEGLYSPETGKGKQYDSKLFALSVLISSYLIFNTTSRLDEKSIDDLGLITELTKLIHTKSNTKVEKGQEFHQIFPTFMWLLRDTFLDLDKYATPKDYLLAALKRDEDDFPTEETERRNRIRTNILSYFKELDCHMLVTPVADAGTKSYEELLRDIDKLKYEELREPFRKGMTELYNKVYANITPKKNLAGTPLNGFAFSVLLESYVEALNKGACPVLEDLWKACVAASAREATVQAEQVYSALMDKLQFPLKWDAMDVEHGKALKAAFDKFRESAIGSAEEQKTYLLALETALVSFKEVQALNVQTGVVEKFKQVDGGVYFNYWTKNHTSILDYNRKLLNDLWKTKIQDHLVVGSPTCFKTIEEYQKALENIEQEYNSKAITGPEMLHVFGELSVRFEQEKDRLKDVLKTLKGYNDKLLQEQSEVIKLQQKNAEIDAKNEQILLSMAAAQRANEEQLEALRKAHSDDLRNMEQKAKEYQEAEAKRMEDLRQANQQQMMEIFQKIESGNKQMFENFMKSSQDNHARMTENIAAMNKALLELAKRPPTVVHSGGGCCFPGTSLVVTEDGSRKPISELAVGDKVASINSAGQLVFSDVYCHYGHNRSARMRNLCYVTPDNKRGVLKMTDEHLVYLVSKNNRNKPDFATYSSFKATIGDYLWVWSTASNKLELCEIVEITNTVEKGQYTVLVLNNCLLVDNVLASSFEVNYTLDLIDSFPLQVLYYVLPSLLRTKTFTSLVQSYDLKVGAVIHTVLPYIRTWKRNWFPN